jgi:hypothetical protein
MRTTDRVRALFEEGATITVVSNTKRPQLDGSTRRITRLGKSFAECDVLSGPGAGAGGFRMPLPTRAGDVLAVSELEATWAMDGPAEGHTLTIRRLAQRELSDTDALDAINAMLSAPAWSVSMLEDTAEVVRRTGREATEGAQHERH